MSPGSSHRHASPSFVMKEEDGSSHHHTSVMDEDITRILSPTTPLRPPLWRRMSPRHSHRHASSSSVMEEDVSKTLSPSRLFVLCYGGGCLQDPLTVTPLCPPVFWAGSHPIHGPMLEFKNMHFEKVCTTCRLKLGYRLGYLKRAQYS